jgi:hypothetical protein
VPGRSTHSSGVMTQVTITAEAAAELLERVARYPGPRGGVMILGPMGPGYRMAADAEEAQLLDLAYGPAQRWVVNILSQKELDHFRGRADLNVHMTEIAGMSVVVLVTHKSDVDLRVELDGDALRFSEQ